LKYFFETLKVKVIPDKNDKMMKVLMKVKVKVQMQALARLSS
jgi:hypothetical protein